MFSHRKEIVITPAGRAALADAVQPEGKGER